jgi:hypothetical protein
VKASISQQQIYLYPAETDLTEHGMNPEMWPIDPECWEHYSQSLNYNMVQSDPHAQLETVPNTSLRTTTPSFSTSTYHPQPPQVALSSDEIWICTIAADEAIPPMDMLELDGALAGDVQMILD